PAPRRTPIDLPVTALLISYIVSFYNVSNGFYFERAVQNFELFVGSVIMYYLIANNTRTQKDLERLHTFWVIAAVSVFLVAIYELNHPGAAFISGWLDFSETTGTEFNSHNIRVGATFHDYELL